MREQYYGKDGEPQKAQYTPAPSILYRFAKGLMEEEELKAANKHFVTYRSRMTAMGGHLVIGRYSVLPFYRELECDLHSVGANMINSYGQHRYVADLQNYVADLGDMTFRTWSFRDITAVPDNIPLIVKGETNSKKDRWSTHMFAKDKQAAVKVYQNLQEDSYIAQQEIYLREYVPLMKLAEGLHGQPITVEFRFFVAYGEVLSGGFYWSNHVGDLETIPSPSMVPQEFLKRAIDKVKNQVNFFAIDIAQRANGDWIVVEVNDGQQSGLSENNPDILYKNLKHLTWDRHQ